jgi:hypothetical protein
MLAKRNILVLGPAESRILFVHPEAGQFTELIVVVRLEGKKQHWGTET